ncbi:MAG: SEC-C metal-binding domain-containing protein, partial [Ornithinibacter sp.]
ESANTPLIGYLNNSIKAKELFTRDKDYVVMNGEVLIVDEHTGRMLAGRRYNEGIHQAIEAKEGVKIQNENQTLATITLQNYFRMYDTLSGMTGTAMTEASELNSIYGLGVVPIPTNMPMVRADQADLVYRTEESKYKAVVDDIVEKHERGQPVLVGTVSVEKSEYLSEQLRRRGVRHEVLNAKHHDREAAIVADAGRKAAVTVATNMAGRGTDIMLGGNPEMVAVSVLKERGLDPHETPEAYEAEWDAAFEAAEKAVADEHNEVTELGGLYVLGTERHESRRIDNQLRGRSGRQGDPGESRFYLSLEDHLMRMFNAGLVDRVMTTAKLEDDQPIESKMVSRSIASAQSQVEAQNYEIRKNVLKYDDVLNRQRTVIYEERRRVLEGEDLQEQLRHFVNDVIEGYVDSETGEGFPEDWDLDRLWMAIKGLYPVSLEPEQIEEAAGGRSALTSEKLKEEILSDAHHAYDQREAALGEEVMREVERRVMLSVLDRKWREHLYEMDYLQEGIGLRAMAQRDPLVEYQREGFALWNTMNEAVKEESVGLLFHVDVKVDEPVQDAAPTIAPMHVSQMLGAMAGAPQAMAVVEDDGMPVTDDPQPATVGAGPASGSGTASGASEEAAPRVQVSGIGVGRPRTDHLHYTAPTETGEVEERDEAGRRADDLTDEQLAGARKNDPCPCGSGKKFKMCHGRR